MEKVSPKELASVLFYEALKASDPYRSVKRYTGKIRSFFQEGGFERLQVVGFGKASCTMAKAIEDSLSDLVDQGIVITKYGHCRAGLDKILVYEAGHPLPDENGVRGTEEIMRLLKDAD